MPGSSARLPGGVIYDTFTFRYERDGRRLGTPTLGRGSVRAVAPSDSPAESGYLARTGSFIMHEAEPRLTRNVLLPAEWSNRSRDGMSAGAAAARPVMG